MMRWMLGLGVAAGLFWGTIPAVAAESCPPAGGFVPVKTVTLSTGIGDITYTADRSSAVITAVSRKDGIGGSGLTTLGLTHHQAEIKMFIEVWSFNLGGGRTCAGLARVDASWRMAKLFVDIASEYPPGGCNYRVIREHEAQHVAFAQGAFRDWTPRIEQALRAAAEQITPQVSNADPAQIRRAMEGQLMAALQPAFEGFRTDLKARNASIDTMANYRKTAALCPRW